MNDYSRDDGLSMGVLQGGGSEIDMVRKELGVAVMLVIVGLGVVCQNFGYNVPYYTK